MTQRINDEPILRPGLMAALAASGARFAPDDPGGDPAPDPDPEPEPAADPKAADPGKEPAPDPKAADPAKDKEPAEDPSKTLASDPGSDDDPEKQPTPATWPDDWRQRMAAATVGKSEGEEFDKELKRLNRFKSPDNVFKSLRAAEQKITSGELKSTDPFPEDGTDEEKAAWRKAQGVPETPDGYLESLPEGLVIGEHDKPMVESFVKDMHERNVSPEVVHAGLQWYYQEQERQLAERQDQDRQIRSESEDALRAEMGGDYRPNLQNMHSMLDTYAPEGLKERLFSARMADGTALGDDADFLRFMTATAREINPTATILPGHSGNKAQSIDEELSDLKSMMSDQRSEYWRGPKAEQHQKRYRELLEAKQRMGSRAA